MSKMLLRTIWIFFLSVLVISALNARPLQNVEKVLAINDNTGYEATSKMLSAYPDEQDYMFNATNRGIETNLYLLNQDLYQYLEPKFFTEISPNNLGLENNNNLQHIRELVSGKVTDADTGEPLPGVNVSVKGTTIGTATDVDGDYELNIDNLNAVLVFSFIGYQKQEVSIGGRTTVDALLKSSLVGLDEVVVTGTGGQTTRREVGNTISSISMDNLPEVQVSIDNLLGSNIAGATVSLGEGMSGAGAKINLRGNSSISMSNYPLVYIDGVRIARGGYPENVAPNEYAGRSSNVTPSPINDIDPNDIERVEVIKGAAATTLYGTQAASGVIQIFTRRGASTDKASWTLQVDQGFKKLQKFGNDEFPYMRIDPWLGNGYSQKYYLSVAGGDRNLRYFISGTMDNGKGVLPNDSQLKNVIRGNFNVSPSNNLNINWNTSFTSNLMSNPPGGNNAQGLTINAFRGPSNYFASEEKSDIDQVLQFKINNNVKHLVTGGSINYDPFAFFTNTLTVGYDYAGITNRSYRPFGFAQLPGGAMSSQVWTTETLTFDYIANFHFDLGSNFTSKTSVGGQSVNTQLHSVVGYSEKFSAPGEPTLNSGGASLSFEDKIREINAGLFGQQVFGYMDKLFLTLGMRFDGNSAFGRDLGMKAYPKVSISYVLSDESFWDTSWGDLKLRAAYGHAGQAPGVFDAVRTWSPVSFMGNTGFLPNTVGNPNLGPERTVETEFGIETHLFNQRLGLDLTYYHQITTDALLPVPQVPSLGYFDPQLENAGKLKNEGIESAIDVNVIQNRNFGFNLGINLATNKSKVISLGGSAPFAVSGAGGWIEEGYPVPAIRGRKVLNADKYEEPIFYDGGNYFVFGPSIPTKTLGLNLDFDLPLGIKLSAKGQYQGGAYIDDSASAEGSKRSSKYWPITMPWFEKMENGKRDELTALQRARTDPNLLAGSYELWIYPADNIRLQNVTLQVPLNFLATNLNNVTLSLSASNFRLWTKKEFLAFDPGMTGDAGVDIQVREMAEQIPAPSSFTASLRVKF